MDISPTSVAAVICQALSPLPSHEAYGLTFLLLQRATCYEGPLGFQGRPPGLCPAPATPRAFMQRLMFPMRGFRQDFPFVTPSVTWQVEWTAMFHGCVAMSGVLARLPRLTGMWPPLGRRRHLGVTWPAFALEGPAGPDLR